MADWFLETGIYLLGVAAGIFPALRALRLQTADALRR